MTDLLIDGFDYDLWANRMWLEYLAAQDRGELWLAYDHLTAVLDLWLERTRGFAPTGPRPQPRTGETLETLHAGWVEAIYANRHDPVVPFRRFNGEAMEMPFSQIARHVVNHGTYHRGELRGICRGLNLTDFPDTDLLLFHRRPQPE